MFLFSRETFGFWVVNFVKDFLKHIRNQVSRKVILGKIFLEIGEFSIKAVSSEQILKARLMRQEIRLNLN